MSTVADPRDIIIAPVISEKSYSELNKNWYTFLVHPDANKTAIKIAIQQIFDVRVETEALELAENPLGIVSIIGRTDVMRPSREVPHVRPERIR